MEQLQIVRICKDEKLHTGNCQLLQDIYFF